MGIHVLTPFSQTSKHVFDWQYIFQILFGIFVANLATFSVTHDYTASKSVLQKQKIKWTVLNAIKTSFAN
jgi:hypothetical protein